MSMSITISTRTRAISRAAAGAAAAAVWAIAIPGPAAAAGAERGNGATDPPSLTRYEKRYLDTRHDFVEANGLRAAGRNIVRDGYLEQSGDVHDATEAEVKDSIMTMKPPPAPAPAATATETTAVTETATSSGGAAAASSTAQCESGGDYGAVNPAGYYGAYQFDQGTWDAYAPSGYAGVNPATAPPEVQDAAAAAVPYDAWPNCP